MNNTMRALGLSQQAGRMTVLEVARPSPSRGEVLVEIKSSAVNEMDVQVRAGGWARYVRKFLKKGPVVSGFEFAGVARSNGQRIRAGDRVIGYVHVLNGPRTHAQYVCVDECCLYPIPERLPFDGAAALVSMGLTAVEILERLKPLSSGQHVLIIGAAGGVGIYTQQLAKSQGAHVTAVCSEKNVAWVQSMGADTIRAYEREAYFKPGDRFDLVVDVPAKASFAQSARFLAQDGMYVTTNPIADLSGFLRASFSRRSAGYLLMLTTTVGKLKRLIELFEQGVLRPVIDSQYSPAKADEAFDRFATSGKQGRVLLQWAD